MQKDYFMRQLITLILVFISTTLILISGEWKTVYNNEKQKTKNMIT